jgi:uncharacterized C2H2 Zn-finger protein
MTAENLEPNYAKLFFLATAKEGEVWHEVVEHRSGYYRCSCGEVFAYGSDIDNHINQINPTYDNPRDILKRMREYCGDERFDLFMAQLEYGNNTNVEGIDWSGNIDIDYILDPPALLQKAVEFLKGEG